MLSRVLNLLATLFLALPAMAQRIETVSRGPVAEVVAVYANMHAEGWQDTLRIPQVRMADKHLEEGINHQLQYLSLNGIAGSKGWNALLKSALYAKQNSGITRMDFTVLQNGRSILSMRIDGEGMGAYPTSFWHYITFDLTRGVPIDGRELFALPELEKLVARVRSAREDSIRQQLELMRTDTSMGIDPDTYASVQESFSECNETVDLSQIGIVNDTLIIPRSACLPHVIQAVDIDWTVILPAREFTYYLSPYGRGIFSGAPPVMSAPPVYPARILHGTIGTMPVTFIVDNYYENYISGSYYYDNKGIPIPISGEVNENALDLREESPKEPFPAIKGRFTDGIFTGTWQQGKGKALPVVLKPF
jgi:hypothetical protein